MKDCKEKELEIGQKVVFTVGTKLITGTVTRVRIANRYNNIYPTVKIRLDIPERRYKKGGWLRNLDGTIQTDGNGDWVYQEGEEKEPKVFRDCYQSDRIMVLDNSTK